MRVKKNCNYSIFEKCNHIVNCCIQLWSEGEEDDYYFDEAVLIIKIDFSLAIYCPIPEKCI